jgi:hypothetical protein
MLVRTHQPSSLLLVATQKPSSHPPPSMHSPPRLLQHSTLIRSPSRRDSNSISNVSARLSDPCPLIKQDATTTTTGSKQLLASSSTHDPNQAPNLSPAADPAWVVQSHVSGDFSGITGAVCAVEAGDGVGLGLCVSMRLGSWMEMELTAWQRYQ